MMAPGKQRLRLPRELRSIQILHLHKEKEMADFRKWLMAFAVITLLLGFGTAALAQGTIGQNAPVTCVASNGAPKQVRVEGVAELLGDVVLNCSGGSPTPVGQPVPLANIRIALSAPITSRTLQSSTGVGEPILTLDEPYPTIDPFPTGQAGIVGAPQGQYGCVATGGQVTDNPYISGTTGKCEIAGVTGASINTYQGQYNTFQGAITNGGLYIDFLGVPVDPPGTQFERIIRVTNLRADATHVPVGQSITATVSVSGTNSLTVPSPYTTVAFVYTGFMAGGVSDDEIAQCNPASGSVGITFSEGFASSFKTGLITTTDATPGPSLNAIRTDVNTDWRPQDLLGTGINYYTESGFTPEVVNTGSLVGEVDGDPALNDGGIGVADYGTRFLITVNNLQNGVTLDFPVHPPAASGSPDLHLQLIANPNADGTGGTWATSDIDINGAWTPTSGATSGFVVYEVIGDDPNLQESVTVNAGVSDTIDLGENVPALGPNSTTSTSTITASFAPIAADTPGQSLLYKDDSVNTTKYGSLPRFIVTQAPQAAVVINPCSCNLLYPWIVAEGGFDTGLAVVNTSISPAIGSTPYLSWSPTTENGTVTLWFTGTRGGAAVVNEYHPNPTNNEPPIYIPGGCAFALVMSTGASSVNCQPVPSGEGSIASGVTAGFVGYIIATTTFQYCHGVAYVSPVDNPFQGAYYEALELDIPHKLFRTGQFGESVGH
jgi:hypothetical protein